MRHVLLTAGLLLGPAVAGAQQAVPATLSLADAIAIARDQNPTYRQALNNRGPAAWGVRNAYSSLLIPNVTTAAGMMYTGPGSQTFLSSSFSQSVSTVSSFYDLSLSWQLSGATLSQPGLAKAQQHASDADAAGAANALTTGITQQYLSVLQARDQAELARKTLERNDEFLKLAQARFNVGQATLIDVRQAQVARGQAAVALLRAQTLVSVEKLRLFEQMGVTPPTDIQAVQLTDTFALPAPAWQLPDLLTLAEDQNPALKALRARERAAAWGVRAATSSYAPTVSVSAGWSGFTQQFTDIDPVRRSQQTALNSQRTACQENNQIRASAGLPASPPDCDIYVWGASYEDALVKQNSVFPFEFTRQPFQARLSISLPIFTNFSRTLRVSEARAQHGDLEEAVRARGLGVQTEVSQAFLTLQTAFRTIGLQDTNRTAAREQLQLATERYRVGSGTFFELLDAQVAGLRAENDYVNAIYDYHKSLAALEAAVGRSLR
ncbi:MAG TPA: TolC family protein [Gemmatimonadales bacterium]|jgi:outer membrane protein|nr:TolC family protein [Gemmatimonadales bacterium]